MAKVSKYPLTREEVLGIKSGELPYSVIKEKYGFHYTIYRNIKLGLAKSYEALLNDDSKPCDSKPKEEIKKVEKAKTPEIPEVEVSKHEDEEPETPEIPEVEVSKHEDEVIKKPKNGRVEALLKDVRKVSFLNGDIYYIPRNGKIERFMFKKENGISLEQALINEGFLK